MSEHTLFRVLIDEFDQNRAFGISRKMDGQSFASANEVPCLVGGDENNSLSHINVRQEGGAASGSRWVPVMPAKKLVFDQLQFLKIAAYGDGLLVQEAGSPESFSAIGGPTVGVPLDVITDILTLNKVYDRCNMHVVSVEATYWELVQRHDDGMTVIETVLAQTITGPGDYGHGIDLDIRVETFLIGTVSLIVRATQLSGGSGTEIYATLSKIRRN